MPTKYNFKTVKQYFLVSEIQCSAPPVWDGILVNTTERDMGTVIHITCASNYVFRDIEVKWMVSVCTETDWQPAISSCEGINFMFVKSYKTFLTGMGFTCYGLYITSCEPYLACSGTCLTCYGPYLPALGHIDR